MGLHSFNNISEFGAAIKAAYERKQLFIKMREAGATQEQIEAAGFRMLKFA